MFELTSELKKKIDDLLTSQKIVLFMKGDRILPKCGFSAQIVEVLDSYKIEYKTFDILEDEEVRQGLKVYSDWPTYPQLYVNQELVGGADIVSELHEAGELTKVLNK